MGSFQNGSGGELSVVLHQKFLSGLVARWGSAFLGISGVNAIHDFVLISAVEAGEFHVLPGGLVHVSTELVGVVVNGEFNALDINHSEEGCDGDNLSNLHVLKELII